MEEKTNIKKDSEIEFIRRNKNHQVSLTDDSVFKGVFTTQKKGLIQLLETITKMKITDLRYLNVEQRDETEDSKLFILDLLVKTNNREIINIEMQCNDNGKLFDRAYLYAVRLASKNIKPGDEYIATKIVTIFLLHKGANFMKEAYDHYHFVSSVTNEISERTLELYFLNITKLDEINPEKLKELELSEDMKTWSGVLLHRKGEKMSPDFEERLTEEMKEVIKKVDDYSLSEWERDAYFKRSLELSAMKTKLMEEKEKAKKAGKKEGRKEGIKEGREEGIKEGREEGREEGIKEGVEKGKEETIYFIIESLLDTNHSDEDIIKITKCDRATLESVKKKIKHNNN